MSMIKKAKQTGFTLIELVIVIAIVAILAAVALPRFVGLQTQARVAKVSAIFGSLRAAAAIGKAACLADLATGTPGTCTNAAGTISMEGTVVNMVNQYPAATAAGIISAAQINTATDGIATSIVGTTITLDFLTPAAATCQITYTSPGAAGSSPTITVANTAC